MDSLGEGGLPASMPAPGQLPSEAPRRVVARAPVLPIGQPPTEAALRWRLRAASIDYVIVYLAYLWVCHMLHRQATGIGHLVVFMVAVAAYHFVLESYFGGQTIGKALMGLRVVSIDGGLAGPQAVAIRSALRVIDQFPVCYMSGLVSLLRTGPERRQRIGDVAADTMVIAVGGRAARRGTPGWMLPTYTVVAVIASILLVYRLSHLQPPLSRAQSAQFIAGCQATIGSSDVACGCVLQYLEADGYNTLSSLRNLMLQVSSEEANTQFGSARQTLYAATLACPR